MKRNIRKIPKDISEKIKTLYNNGVIVGCAGRFSAEDLESGKLSNLGITLDQSGLYLENSIIPTSDSGKYSSYNINGREIIRRDLPKETHYNSIESPNWGDSYNGTHTVNLPYKKFPREFRSPRELEIVINCDNKEAGLSEYIISFQVLDILDKNDNDFENKLFENLNLLQENVGMIGVESADMSISEYTATLNLSWEILPPGTLEDTLQRLFRTKQPTDKQKEVASQRYTFFLSLKPKNLIYGRSGLRRYFGAQITDGLVVFENIEYGNAIYVLFDNWEKLSQLSRIDLLSGEYENQFIRIIHEGPWEREVRKIISDRCNKKE